MPRRRHASKDLLRETAELRARLALAEQTLDAIRCGDVDALVVAGPRGDQVYTLKGAEEPYRVLVEQISEGALTVSAGGIVLYANQALAQLLGRPLEKVIGARLVALFGDAGPQALAELLRSAAATGRSRAEVALCREGGGRVVLRLAASRLSVDGETAFCMVASDLTEAYEQQAQLQRLHDALEDRVRARTKELAAANCELEAFAYSISHDLRAPLRAMDGFSLALLEDYRDRLDEKGRDALERIRKASQHMDRLIDELLDLSRITYAELKLTDVDLSAAAREVADSLQQSQPAREVRWEIAGGLRTRADAGLLRIALYNLMGNAWKFTGHTGRPVIRVGGGPSGGTTEYYVADNGVGFDMAHAGKLFDAFQRLHHLDEFPGTGIGLATVQRIVRRHGGAIHAAAAPGKGAAFYFTLGAPPQ